MSSVVAMGPCTQSQHNPCAFLLKNIKQSCPLISVHMTSSTTFVLQK